MYTYNVPHALSEHIVKDFYVVKYYTGVKFKLCYVV